MTADTVIALFLVLIIAALATWQTVEIWHHSALMALPRSHAQLIDGFVGKLLTCPFCLSVWVGGFFIASASVSVVLLEKHYVIAGVLLLSPANTLALSRLANVANDLMYHQTRTPKENRLPKVVSVVEETNVAWASVALMEGIGAFRNGADLAEDNPYNRKQYPDRYDAWQNGYRSAQRADELKPLSQLLT